MNAEERERIVQEVEKQYGLEDEDGVQVALRELAVRVEKQTLLDAAEELRIPEHNRERRWCMHVADELERMAAAVKP